MVNSSNISCLNLSIILLANKNFTYEIKVNFNYLSKEQKLVSPLCRNNKNQELLNFLALLAKELTKKEKKISQVLLFYFPKEFHTIVLLEYSFTKYSSQNLPFISLYPES
jgi:hypothetical protein